MQILVAFGACCTDHICMRDALVRKTTRTCYSTFQGCQVEPRLCARQHYGQADISSIKTIVLRFAGARLLE
jgi:hypothetical protein